MPYAGHEQESSLLRFFDTSNVLGDLTMASELHGLYDA